MKKKAFTLFSTLILIFIFSILIVSIFETKSMNSINIQKQYSYIQAKNHLAFLEEYITKQKDLKTIKKIEIQDNHFNILADITKKDKNYEANLYIKSKLHNISVHKKILIK
ncbi:hypothetical protein [Arcobacter sp. LA11]|uniref:hypothetical protein n=1 Tax=Arcobacter sp. LA11 TaxID=1898176 RepID=UPI000932DFB6|nr:hypothetical protein [Arcobacter sp. LA11]